MLEYSHDHGLESPLELQGDYPLQTRVTTEMMLYVEALQILFSGDQPLLPPSGPLTKENFGTMSAMLPGKGLEVPLNTLMGQSSPGKVSGKLGLQKGFKSESGAQPSQSPFMGNQSG